MVMSIGWNPFYKNEKRSVEVHLLAPETEGEAEHSKPNDQAAAMMAGATQMQDFYDAHMNLLILGFIRPEHDYVSKEALVEDIQMDIRVARKSLAREHWGEKWRGERCLVRRPDVQGRGKADGVGDMGP